MTFIPFMSLGYRVKKKTQSSLCVETNHGRGVILVDNNNWYVCTMKRPSRNDLKSLASRVTPDSSPTPDLLRLAVVWEDVAHDHRKSIGVLEEIIKREPTHHQAQILLAHSLIHFMMDRSSLNRAVGILKNIVGNAGSPERAGAYQLLGEALDEMGRLSLTDHAGLLEQSVVCGPTWVFNHQQLGWIFWRQGKWDEGEQEARKALANVQQPDSTLPIEQLYYEEEITGRQYRKATLEENIKILRDFTIRKAKKERGA